MRYNEDRTSERIKKMDGIFRSIPIDCILPDEYQPRRNFDEKDMKKLEESITQVGVIQPLSVRYAGDGKYRIIAGERRYRACLRAGIKSLPCLVFDTSEEDAAVLTVTENLQRKDLNCFEQAQGIAALMKGLGLSQSEVAKKLGISQSAVANKIRLLRIPEEIRSYLIENRMGERQARALLSVDGDELPAFAKYMVENKMNSAGAEELVSEYVRHKKRRKRGAKMRGYCGDVRLYMNSLNQTLGLMRSSGMASESKKEEFDDRVVYTFVINKA